MDSTRNAFTRVDLVVLLVQNGGAVDDVLPRVPRPSGNANA
jgi:hypothetical protein